MPTVNKWMASTEDTLEIDIHLIKQKAISLLKDTISSQYNFNFFEFTVHRTLLNKPVLRIKKLAEAKTGI